MTHLRTIGYSVLTALVVVGLIAPAGALLASGAASAQTEPASSVTVGAGQQLSAVIVAASSDVRAEFEETAFEIEIDRANESERAAALAERAATLRERATSLRAAFEEARTAREAGDLTASEYAFRLATLNARAGHLLESLERLQDRSDTVSPLELRAAGLKRSELRTARDDLDGVVGAGPAAILQRFTGDAEGEIRIESRDGLSISVEGERGEVARELERDRDDDPAMTVPQADALETATDALSEQAAPWQLRKASVHPDSGYYKFEFVMRTANASGEAEVRVDGSSGELFRLEEEIESERDDDDGDDEAESDEEVSLVLVDGTPRPNGNVTVQALIDGSPLPDATVRLNGEIVGTTDADGRLEVTLAAGESEFEVRHGDEDGELEFEFEDDDEVFRHLQTSATHDDGQITLSVAYDGDPVDSAVVSVNGERVGRTDTTGRLSFAAPGSETLEVEIEKGEFEAELTYELRNGSLVLTEEAHEAADDREEDERDDDEDREDEDDTEEREDDEENDHDEDDATCDDESEDHDHEDDECEDVDEDEEEDDDDDDDDDEAEENDEDGSGSNSGSG